MIAKSQENLLDGQGRISGRVVKGSNLKAALVEGTAEGDAYPDVTVFLVRVSDGQVMTTVVTDENGNFEIIGIPAGEYQLMLDVVGVDLNLEGSTFTVDEEGTPQEISAVVGKDGIVFTIEEAVGVDDIKVELAVYPNPAAHIVNIQVNGNAVVRLIDLRGVVLNETTFTDHLQLDVASLKEDVYMLEITSNHSVSIQKLIKKNQ